MAHTFDEAISMRNSDYVGANAAMASAAAYAAAFAIGPNTSELTSRLLAAEAENRRLRQILFDVGAVLDQALQLMKR